MTRQAVKVIRAGYSGTHLNESMSSFDRLAGRIDKLLGVEPTNKKVGSPPKEKSDAADKKGK